MVLTVHALDKFHSFSLFLCSISEGYLDTDALLKEKLSQMQNNDGGDVILGGFVGGQGGQRPPAYTNNVQMPRYMSGDNMNIPPKRQMSNISDDSKSTITGSYESEGGNEQWYVT